MANVKCEYRKAWADENDQVWQGETKRSTEEGAEEGANERGEWTVTKTANASHGQDAEAFQETEEDSGEKMKSVVRAFREKGRTFLWGILWLRFPLAHTTHKEVGVTHKVSIQDIFSGTLRCSVARSNLFFKEIITSIGFCLGKNAIAFHNPVESEQPSEATGEKRWKPTDSGAETDYWDDQGNSLFLRVG